jgi:hypothetical protein
MMVLLVWVGGWVMLLMVVIDGGVVTVILPRG